MKPKNIYSLNNSKIIHLARLRNSRAYRDKMKTALVIGKKFIEDIGKIYPPLMILQANETCSCSCDQTLDVTPEILSKICGISLSKGTVAEIAIPPSQPLQQLEKLLVIDRIKDPGNLGAMVRSAIAFGWNHLFLLPGSCDLFNEKVIRASAGSCFFAKREEGEWSRLKQLAETQNLEPLIADTEGTSVDQINSKRPLLVISSESFGPSEELKNWGQKVTIPTKTVESLNAAVAGGILLYLL